MCQLVEPYRDHVSITENVTTAETRHLRSWMALHGHISPGRRAISENRQYLSRYSRNSEHPDQNYRPQIYELNRQVEERVYLDEKLVRLIDVYGIKIRMKVNTILRSVQVGYCSLLDQISVSMTRPLDRNREWQRTNDRQDERNPPIPIQVSLEKVLTSHRIIKLFGLSCLLVNITVVFLLAARAGFTTRTTTTPDLEEPIDWSRVNTFLLISSCMDLLNACLLLKKQMHNSSIAISISSTTLSPYELRSLKLINSDPASSWQPYQLAYAICLFWTDLSSPGLGSLPIIVGMYNFANQQVSQLYRLNALGLSMETVGRGGALAGGEESTGELLIAFHGSNGSLELKATERLARARMWALILGANFSIFVQLVHLDTFLQSVGEGLRFHVLGLYSVSLATCFCATYKLCAQYQSRYFE